MCVRVCVCSPNHWCNHDLKVALLVDVWEEVVSEYMKEHSCSEAEARSNAKAAWLLDWCVSVCVRLCECVFLLLPMNPLIQTHDADGSSPENQ